MPRVLPPVSEATAVPCDAEVVKLVESPVPSQQLVPRDEAAIEKKN